MRDYYDSYFLFY